MRSRFRLNGTSGIMGQLRILDRRCFGTSRISVDSIIFEAATYPAKRSATDYT